MANVSEVRDMLEQVLPAGVEADSDVEVKVITTKGAVYDVAKVYYDHWLNAVVIKL